MKLKNINEQVMVITGATSGIGLTTARMAAEQGVKLLLVARNEDALRQLTDEINQNGGSAGFHACDVANEGSLREAANKAVSQFGRIDTWVNNAGASTYGRIMDVPIEDLRRVFETNVWGVVYGSRIAVEFMGDNGGALINVGSEVSDAPVPLQGIYSSSKHAVKGFTDSLRMELEADGLPISVSLVKPTATHTPFPENAKNFLPYEPQLPGPLYSPDLVAEAILYCAENPTREFFVGEMSKAHSSFAMNAPRLYEKFNESMIDTMQNSGEPAEARRPDGLHHTNSKLQERGSEDRFVLENSVYQKAVMHPLLTAGLLAGGSLAVAALLKSRKVRSDGPIANVSDRNRQGMAPAMNRQQMTPSSAAGRQEMNTGTQTGQGSMSSGTMTGAAGSTQRSMNMSASAEKGSMATTGGLNISEHMEVVGSDGQHVGTVDKVEGDQIKLTRDDSPDGMHHRISLRDVETVKQDRVMLSRPANEAKANWRTA